MKIDSHDREITEILNSGFYAIPRFQRPYRWNLENVSDFWTDTIQDSESDYFIGPMVVFKSESGIFGIVDGQQRLTTITMILCALRDVLSEEGFGNLAQGIHNLIETRDIDNKPSYILATESSFPYFQEYIQKFGRPDITVEPLDEEKNLERAFKVILGNVRASVQSVKDDPTSNEDEKHRRIKEKLKAIRDKILSLKIIFVTLDNEDDAYIIFETLNTRGMNLGVSDLVKNHLTRLLRPDSAVDTPRMKWNEILETIESSSADLNTDTFLHHFWLSKYSYVTIKKLFRLMKMTVKRENALAFLDNLVKDAVTYREIHETGFRQWAPTEKEIRESLEAFTLFRVRQQTPMVLSVMRDYKAGRLKRKYVQTILSAIENFHFIFTAVTSQRSSGGISQMYASAARRLDEAKSEAGKKTILRELHEKLRERIPSYEEFEANFREILFSKNFTKQRRLVKYILTRVDSHHNQTAIVNYDQMTIEHLSPQASQAGEAGELIIAQLGNQILVTQSVNERLADKDFAEKKKILRECNIYLDHIIQSADTWTAQEIDRRTKWMAKLAYNTIWKI